MNFDLIYIYIRIYIYIFTHIHIYIYIFHSRQSWVFYFEALGLVRIALWKNETSLVRCRSDMAPEGNKHLVSRKKQAMAAMAMFNFQAREETFADEHQVWSL